MADNNKIQLGIEIDDSSLESSFSQVDKRATRSAKQSAETFETFFKQQDRKLAETIKQHEAEVARSVGQSAKDSAKIFIQEFEKQSKVARQIAIENRIADATGMSAIKKSAKDSAGVFKDAFASGALKTPSMLDSAFSKLSNVTLPGVASALYIAQFAFDKVTKAVEGMLNTVLEGEQKIRLEERFKNVAAQAGIAANVLEHDLGKAVKGLVDDDKLLKLASESFIQIGKNAGQLPTILELARKTYKNFGGDIVSNAESIISAVETGNKKQLKTIGLYTDLDKAIREYAASQGKRVELMTVEEIQQARLNAVLEIGSRRFGSLPEPADGATEALVRLSNAFNNLNDAGKKFMAESFGGIITKFAQGAANLITAVNQAIARESSPEGSIQKIQYQIDVLKQFNQQAVDILSGKNDLAIAMAGGESALKKAISDRTKLIEEHQAKINALNVKAKADAKKSEIDSTTNDITFEVLKAQEALTSRIRDLKQQQITDSVQAAQAQFSVTKSQADYDKLIQIKNLQDTEAYLKQKADFEKFYRENGIKNKQAHDQAIELIDLQFRERQKQNQMQADAQLIELAANRTMVIEGLWGSTSLILDAMKNKVVTTFDVISKATKELGKNFVATFQTQMTKALFSFAQGSIDAQQAASQLFTGLLNAMGEMMINQGLGFMLQGAAFAFAGLPNGAQLATAGAAMVAFGMGLAAVSAANGGKAAVASTSGGGSAGGTTDMGGTSPVADATPPESTVAQQPGTAINLTINGNVLDRRQTGLEIAEVLREEFGNQGLVIA